MNKAKIEKNFSGKHGTELLRAIEEWWRSHRYDFPSLFRTAKGLLAVQATSVNCERAFSAAGAEFSKKRCSMQPETLESLCLIRGNVGPDLSLEDLISSARKVSAKEMGKDEFEEFGEPECDDVL